MDTKEIIKYINNMSKNDFETVYFTDGYYQTNASKINHVKKILKKLDEKNQYTFVTEFITNYYTFIKNKFIPIVYKPIDSHGYDGIFLDKERNDIYLSETKSSNANWDTTTSNINTRLKSAYRYIRETLFYKEELSHSVDDDHNKIMWFYIKKEYSKELNPQQKNNLLKRIKTIQEQTDIGITISAAVSKSDQAPIIQNKKDEIITAIIVENLKEYEKIQLTLRNKIKELYEL